MCYELYVVVIEISIVVFENNIHRINITTTRCVKAIWTESFIAKLLCKLLVVGMLPESHDVK